MEQVSNLMCKKEETKCSKIMTHYKRLKND